MKKRLYIDVSYLVHHNYLNTGIQRVVRRVVEEMPAVASAQGYTVQPIDLSYGHSQPVSAADLYRAPFAAESSIPMTAAVPSWPQRTLNYFAGIYLALKQLALAILPFRLINRWFYAAPSEWGLDRLIREGVFRPSAALWRVGRQGYHRLRAKADSQPTETPPPPESLFGPDDILLLLDSTWYCDIWPAVDRARAEGTAVVAVIYDLIPITHRQFCDDFLVATFKTWFYDSLDRVDGYIAISKTVQHDLQAFMHAEFADRVANKTFDYFWLGADFHTPATPPASTTEPDGTADAPVQLSTGHTFPAGSTYLIVSTVEPRKNHAYLMDAFEPLWAMGETVNLLIVGRVGWKVEALIQRIENSSVFNQHLFLWLGLDDADLMTCYRHSKALVFPSIIEGFGLPIVEALSYGLPVIASDIPIHREIGGERIQYVDLQYPRDLTDLILQIEREGMPQQFLPNADWRWQQWDTATQELLRKVLLNLAKSSQV